MVILLYCTICLGNTLYHILCSSDTAYMCCRIQSARLAQPSLTVLHVDQHTFGIVVTLSYRAILTYLIAVLLLHRELVTHFTYIPYCYCVPLTPYVVETHYNTVCHTGTIIINCAIDQHTFGIVSNSHTFIPCYIYILDCCATPTQ